ncbi:hypothetical protein IRJ16_15560 [Mucilaginibacter myungsuensis]|uniref:Uncharacterized protein n=1 Tax=Mucilaginibacter myungsuensis TaxID=649104 RepID=A0A929PYC4_9SPHI|nr:hypothetical protein [Mucilaginibacter myungsuensis]
MTLEKAEYIFVHYSNLLSLTEKKALKHYHSTLKLEDQGNTPLRRMYMKVGWLTDDPIVLNYLSEGYIQFMLTCAERILTERPNDVLFNLCPICKKLARTPHAKQCRHCGHNWHPVAIDPN